MAFIPNSGSVAAWLQSDNASVITVGSGSVFAIVQNLQGASVSGTVIANQGTNPWVITGSVQASLTPAANQSVSGTVGASVIGLTPVAVTNTPSISGTVNVGNTVTINPPSVYGNISGSVVAFINNTPAVSVQGTVFVSGSVITVGGSGTPNQSVSGTVGASILGNVNTTITSVATVGGFLNVNLVGGSILTSSTPNQSVSGTVNVITGNASVITIGQGSIAVAIISGSIAASFTPPANQSVSGTVQTDIRGSVATVIIGGSIAASFIPPANQSVSGTVQTQVQGSVAVAIISGSIAASFTPPANQSVSGAVSVSNFPTTQNVSGSVIAFVTGTPAVSVQGTVFVSGSVITVGGTANQSVSGTVGASLIGLSPVIVSDTQGQTLDIYQEGDVDASVVGLALMWKSNLSSSILSTVTTTTPLPVQVTGTVPSQSVSGTVGASIIGQLPAGNAVIGAVAASISGTVITTFTNSSIIALQSGSVVSINQGSIASAQIGTAITSIVGSFLEDSASANADPGVFVFGVRNDTLSSVTSTDGDYTQFTVGPAGETIIANAPYTKWVQGSTSIFGATSVAVLAAQGASVFTYITGLQVANASANNVYVTLGTGSNSILGYTVAPANGGSNIYFPNALKTTQNGTFTASINGVASVYLSAQGFISKI